MPLAELRKETARRLGYSRLGSRVETAMAAGIACLLGRSGPEAVDTDGVIALPRDASDRKSDPARG